MKTEYDCSLFYYDNIIRRIFCCDCFLDHVNFLVEEKEKNFTEIIEKSIRKEKDSFYFYYLGEALLLSCSAVIRFIRESKNVRLFRDFCLKDVIWCEDERINLCFACVLDLIIKNDILHFFQLKE